MAYVNIADLYKCKTCSHMVNGECESFELYDVCAYHLDGDKVKIIEIADDGRSYTDTEGMINHIKDMINECDNPDPDKDPTAYGIVLGLKGALSYAETLPVVKMPRVKHGYWKVVYKTKKATVYECSECQHLDLGTSAYCVCGAKMDDKVVEKGSVNKYKSPLDKYREGGNKDE